jgi:hypothetical protein
VAQVSRALLRRPDLYLLARWNWKSALLSAIGRSALFFRATSSAGPSAAFSASATEFALALALAGFVGAFAQAYRGAQPRWLAFLMAATLPPVVWHACEVAAHLVNGTPHLARGVSFSVAYSAAGSALTLFLMRRGVWLAGEERTSLRQDLTAIFAIIRRPGHGSDPGGPRTCGHA